jgi:NAD(P)-dependent dehydrogenase (short-subunit alcohol dehydrogenase family)
MELAGKTVLLLGGTGLVGSAIAREVLAREPRRIVVAGLREEEAKQAVASLAERPGPGGVEVLPEWGDIFLREEDRERARRDLVAEPEGRSRLLDDLFGPLDESAVGRSALVALLERHRPDVLVDCINTATAIAYQDVFGSARRLRRRAASTEGVSAADVEAHLCTLYLPQLIRHIQLLLEGIRRAGTRVYLKIGTSGTGGMGLDIPFTHSEQRPSGTLLAKSSLAGAHSLLLFLMARTNGAPAVKEIKPTAAIAWKEIGFGPVLRGGRPIERYDAVEPLPMPEAFGSGASEGACRRADGVIESVYLDAGENGRFSLGEFEAISSLRMMEVITPEEIAWTAVAEIEGRPTGRDIVGALDASSSGPTYRGGVLRDAALRRMEALETEHGVRSVAFEMLGPPRLSKLLFEASLLQRLLPDLEAGAAMDSEDMARQASALIESDATLRSDIVSIGIPILLPDGERLLRGPEVKVAPAEGRPADVGRLAARGWVDLRPASWSEWKERCRRFLAEEVLGPDAGSGSGADLDVRSRSGEIRPGALAAYVFRVEDGGERMKR